MAENRNIFPDRSNIFLVQLIDGQDYSWNAVAPDILGLKNRLGFGNDLSFLHVRLADEGTFWFENPVDSTKTVVQDEVFGYKARRVLFYYSRGDETLQVPEEREIFTKISLLDDSMHLGCSTNQHRIENDFRMLIDGEKKRTGLVLETYFNARPLTEGDAAFRVVLLPLVPVKIVYHAAEFNGTDFSPEPPIPSSCNIFFEKHANKFLPPNVCESLEDMFLEILKIVVHHADKSA